jgi:sortase A
VRIVIRKAPLRSALRWGKRLLGLCAVLTLSYCVVVLADGWLFQKAESHRFEQLLHAPSETGGAARIPAPAAAANLIGRMDIPRLGLSVVVLEGVDKRTLRRAAGHIPGTALPGQPGNVGISGHRDTFFRPLRNIRDNDIVTLTTLRGEYRYRVVSTRIVTPSDLAVLNPSGDEVLTLVTCYPFYFIGPAPSRFVVRAERSSADLRSAIRPGGR